MTMMIPATVIPPTSYNLKEILVGIGAVVRMLQHVAAGQEYPPNRRLSLVLRTEVAHVVTLDDKPSLLPRPDETARLLQPAPFQALRLVRLAVLVVERAAPWVSVDAEHLAQPSVG